MSQRQFLSRHNVGTKRRKPIMTAKLDPFAVAPELMKEWHRISVAISSSLDPGLAELVKIRASQIKGCANCLNMHTVFARENGETEQRLYLLGLARGHLLYRSRACRARLDRGSDAAVRRAYARERLRSPEGSLHGRGAGQAHIDDQRHQRMEPHRSWFRWLGRSGGRKVRCHGGRRLTTNAKSEDAAVSFGPLRPKLMRVAHGVLGFATSRGIASGLMQVVPASDH